MTELDAGGGSARPGDGRRDLAQQQDRFPGHPVNGRLRPLTRIDEPAIHGVGKPPCGLLTTKDKDPSTR
jgi:hypothetical protein